MAYIRPSPDSNRLEFKAKMSPSFIINIKNTAIRVQVFEAGFWKLISLKIGLLGIPNFTKPNIKDLTSNSSFRSAILVRPRTLQKTGPLRDRAPHFSYLIKDKAVVVWSKA